MSGERRLLYVTFGGRYGNPEEAQQAFDAGRAPKDPHPTADWATGRGYLVVEYGLSVTDVDPDDIADVRARARLTAHTWLDGRYAFDYDDQPTAEECPLGEVARMVLP